MVALGLLPAAIALTFGLFFFFVYAARYYVYVTILLFLNVTRKEENTHNGNGNGNGRHKMFGLVPSRNNYRNGNGHNGNGKSVNYSALNGGLITQPLVSIHLPLYNEPNVVERLLTACTSLDYNNYEVIVIDDSTDKTVEMLRGWAEANQISFTSTGGTRATRVQVTNTLASMQVLIRIIHRAKRSGFKGGALNEALKHMSPEAEYVMIFDADFIPPPDIIKSFLAYYQTLSQSDLLAKITKLDREYADGKVSLDVYLSERERLASELRGRKAITESSRQAIRSLFTLDQLYADKAIEEFEYTLRRKAMINEMSKIPVAAEQYVQEPLALKRAFIVSQLFAEDKIDTSDFKTRMRSIFSPLRARAKPSTEQDLILLQILDFDRDYAQGNITAEDYQKKREQYVAKLRTLTEDVGALKATFGVDQSFVSGEMPLEQYLQVRRNNRRINGNRNRNGNGNGNGKSQLLTLGNPLKRNGNGSRNGNGFEYVAIQGYQLHNLNQSESWLTTAIRAEYSGSYMVERVCEQLFGAMRMISGSVYMIRADVLRQYKWAESITEDWELTCRLYLDGKRVGYTPNIQAPAECPSTIKRLIKQRQRWAEGHTYNVKRYFWSVVKSPKLTIREKLEFLYFAPYYLQSVFFIVGTSVWLWSETIHEYLPFWTQTFGWALLLSNLLALPLMNLSGLFSEREAMNKKDLSGIFSAIVLPYILSVFQAYSALKGLFEKREGTWIRTYKTGVITETIRKFQLGKYWRSLAKPRRTSKKKLASKSKDATGSKHGSLGPSHSVRTMLIILILSLGLITVTGLSFTIQEVQAALPTTPFYFYNDAVQNSATTCAATRFGTLSQTAPAAGSLTLTANNKIWCWASTSSFSTDSGDNGVWTFHFVFTSNNLPTGNTITIKVYIGSTRTTLGTQVGTASISTTGLTSPSDTSITVSGVPTGTANFVQFTLLIPSISGSPTITMTTSSVGSTLTVPESVLILAGLVPLIPFALRRRSIKHIIRPELPTQSARIRGMSALSFRRPLLADHVLRPLPGRKME